MRKNHYKTLGLTPGASAEEIKQAYRKLAMRYHPDRNNGDKKSEEKFKEVKEAYEALTNPQNDINYQPSGGRSGRDFDIDDILRTHFQHDFQDFFKPKFQLDLSFWEAALGCKKVIHISDGGKNETISINIPGAIFDGEELNIRIKNKNYSIVINILEEPGVERNRLDILMPIGVPFDVACLGGELIVPHWEGDIKVQIPAGTQSNQTLRLNGKGLKRQGETGNLFLKIEIVVPKKMSEKQKEILLKWRDVSDGNWFTKKKFWH